MKSGIEISLLHLITSIRITLIMGNITLTVDEGVVKKVRRVALEKDTTLTAMVRDYLNQIADSVDARKLQDSETLRKTFRQLSRPMGKRDWKRDDLYE